MYIYIYIYIYIYVQSWLCLSVLQCIVNHDVLNPEILCQCLYISGCAMTWRTWLYVSHDIVTYITCQTVLIRNHDD